MKSGWRQCLKSREQSGTCVGAQGEALHCRLKNYQVIQRAEPWYNWDNIIQDDVEKVLHTEISVVFFLQLLNTLKEMLVLLPNQMVLSTHTVHHLYELSMLKHCLAWGRAGWHLTKLKQMLKQQMMNKLKAADKQKSKAYVQFYWVGFYLAHLVLLFVTYCFLQLLLLL